MRGPQDLYDRSCHQNRDRLLTAGESEVIPFPALLAPADEHGDGVRCDGSRQYEIELGPTDPPMEHCNWTR